MQPETETTPQQLPSKLAYVYRRFIQRSLNKRSSKRSQEQWSASRQFAVLKQINQSDKLYTQTVRTIENVSPFTQKCTPPLLSPARFWETRISSTVHTLVQTKCRVPRQHFDVMTVCWGCSLHPENFFSHAFVVIIANGNFWRNEKARDWPD